MRTNGTSGGKGKSGRQAAYFDLDKTVLATSTTLAMGDPMRRSGLISTTALARGVVAQLPYLLIGADEAQGERLMNQLARLSTGVERSRLQEVVAQAMSTAIEPAVYTEALDLIEAHRRAGHDVVIVSGSAEEMVEPIAALVGADRSVASRMEVDGQGRFTGRISRSLLHGAKVEALEADARAHGIDLSASWAYSDSVSDLPMLQAVGHPVAVNPDRDLRRRAQDWEREADLLMRLAEHTEPVLAEQLPGHLSASTFIRLSEDPQGTVHELLRPVPQRPSRAATIGTEVHALIEEHFGVVPSADPLEAPEAEDTLGVILPGAVEPAGETAPEEVAGEGHLEFAEGLPQDALFDELSLAEESEQDSSVRSLWERFAASEWGSPGWKERIWAVEYPVETHVEGVSLRGRIDAVFRTEDGDGERWILVDWKTGRRPKAAAMQARRFQLGLYRIAFSRIMGIDPERISTVFVYLGGKRVEEVWDEQIRGGLPSEAQLAAVIRKARAGEG